jgi:hypothetical protein
MSILGKIFSSGANELVKGVGGVIDELHTSKEEKLEAERKIKDMIMGYEANMQQHNQDYANDGETDKSAFSKVTFVVFMALNTK